YTHVELYDTAGALDALPDLTRPSPTTEPAALSATGTDDRPISRDFAAHLPHSACGKVRDGAAICGDDDLSLSTIPATSIDAMPSSGAALAGPGRDDGARMVRVGDGIRTRDIQIRDLVPRWSLAGLVVALQALRGVGLVVAVTVAAEVGEMARFESP